MYVYAKYDNQRQRIGINVIWYITAEHDRYDGRYKYAKGSECDV
jgi:hypothetical protein